MNDKSEATRLADEAGNEIGKADPQWEVIDAAIEMLRRWPDGEPVAVVHWDDIGHISWRTNVMLADGTLLYTAPPDQSDRIAALEHENAALEAALEQAARICDEFQRQHGDSDNHGAFLALRIRALAREVQGC